MKWFDDKTLDYTETYTLKKNDRFYELIKVETTKDNTPEYKYKNLQEKFEKAGLSSFWLALTMLFYKT